MNKHYLTLLSVIVFYTSSLFAQNYNNPRYFNKDNNVSNTNDNSQQNQFRKGSFQPLQVTSPEVPKSFTLSAKKYPLKFGMLKNGLIENS